MKVQHETITVQTKGVQEEAGFQMSSRPEDAVHLFRMISDMLYKDKVLAVTREYITNAFDAHAEHGVDLPIEITLPGVLEQVFRVRDFGPGLSHEFMMNEFVLGGRSTKRDSDAVAGCFGIGRLSGFSYSAAFSIISHHAGTKRVYNCFLGEDRVGRVALMSESPTDETGLEVCLPVKQGDALDFHYKVQQMQRFYSSPATILPEKLAARPEVRYSGEGWRIDDAPGVYAVMGNVGYPVNSSDLPSEFTQRFLWQTRGLVVEVPIGSLTITASRDTLEMSDLTVSTLQQCTTDIFESLAKHAKDTVENAPNLLSAVMARSDLYENLPSNLADAVLRDVSWNNINVRGGIPIHTVKDEPFFRPENTDNGATLLTAVRGARRRDAAGHTVKITSVYNPSSVIRLENLENLWYLPHGVRLNNARFRYLVEHTYNYDTQFVYVLPKGMDIEEFIDTHQLEGITFKYASDLPPLPKRERDGTTTRTPGVGGSAFTLSDYASTQGRGSSNWDRVDDVNKKTDGGVYVPLWKFKVDEPSAAHDTSITMLHTIRKLLGIEDIYGFRTKDVPKLGRHWKPLREELRRKLQTITSDHISRIHAALWMRNTHALEDAEPWIRAAKEIVEDQPQALSIPEIKALCNPPTKEDYEAALSPFERRIFANIVRGRYEFETEVFRWAGVHFPFNYNGAEPNDAPKVITRIQGIVTEIEEHYGANSYYSPFNNLNGNAVRALLAAFILNIGHRKN